tara:strand:- start:335 stop:1312 length:978 start_codon:yes stop_codon:yes gene_type:complete
LINNQIGIIGVGYWGTNIVNVIVKLNIKKIYCYDKNKENLKEIKRKFPNIITYNSFKEFLNLNISGVIIAVNTNDHYEVAKKCLEKGFNIFVEKPVTSDSKKLINLEKLAQKKKKFIMSGYIYLYNNYVQYIKKIIKKNLLGKILYVSFERLNLGPVRNDVSSAWDLSSHDIAICIYLFGNKLKILNKSGYAILKTKINDICSVSARSGDIKIDFRSSWLNPEKIRKIVIVGKKKMILFNEMDFKNPIKIFNKYASYPKVNKFNKNFFTQKANIYLGSTLSPKIKSQSPLENEMKEFIKCIKLKKKPLTGTKISYKVLRILQNLN